MRTLICSLLASVILLTACGQTLPQQPTRSSPPPPSPTFTNPPPTKTATTVPPTPTVTFLPPTPTATRPVILSQEVAPSPDQPLLAYEIDSGQNKVLFLSDLTNGMTYQYSFPTTSRFATPFLAGLSPDARYFAYFEGGWLETLYNFEHLRAIKPNVILHVLDLHTGQVIFSTPLLSPTYPQDLTQVAETIKEDWWFRNDTLEEAVFHTQEFMLDNLRNIAWSPDSSLLAFASQNPGPTSDLFLFSLKDGTAQRVTRDSNHVQRISWAPDSSAFVLVTSLYDRQAREDTTYFFTRDGSLLTSLTSQLYFFRYWHNPTYAILYSGTDSGEFVELDAVSTDNGKRTTLWNGSYSGIAFTPDLSTFLLNSIMPNAPTPRYPGLFLGNTGGGSLRTLSKAKYWWVAYWGSQRFDFAASSSEEGTIGITPAGNVVKIDPGYWRLTASPDGSYLAGYNVSNQGYGKDLILELRIFNGRGKLLNSIKDVNVTCLSWNAESTRLVYQTGGSLFFWDSSDDSTYKIADGLDLDECAFKWVQDAQ